MRTAATEKAPNKRVVLQPAEMKQTLAAENPSNDEIEQDAENGEQRVALFGTIQFLQRFTKLYFSRYSRKILLPPTLVAFDSVNSVLILEMDVIDFTFKVLLSLWVMFSTNTILPKIRSTFHIFKGCHFQKFRLICCLKTIICSKLYITALPQSIKKRTC